MTGEAWTCPECAAELPGAKRFDFVIHTCPGCGSRWRTVHDCYSDGECDDYLERAEPADAS